MKTERKPVDEKMCRQAKLLLAGGATGEEAAEIMGVSTGTISRMKKAGFDMETFRKNTEARRIRERQVQLFDELNRQFPEMAPEAQAEQKAEEQVPGQICMELAEEEEAKPEMSDAVKLMRFLGGKLGSIDGKLDFLNVTAALINENLGKIYDYLGQILRRTDR